MKKILITGASGYIGQHLAKLLSDSFDVYGLDIVEPKDFEPFDWFWKWDIRDRMYNSTDIIGLLKHEFHTVIHLAALVRVNESVEKPIEYYNTNINGTLNVLSCFNYDNFIFASTGAAAQPSSPYAISKVVAEQCVRQHCSLSQIDHTIFRFYNVIGSAGYPPTNPDGLFYNLINAKETGVFNLYGNDYNTLDGTPVRDYVHVMEICNAIKNAIENPANTPVENLGHGHGHSVKEMSETFQKVNNCEFQINYVPRREGDLESSVLDNVSSYMEELYSFEDLMKCV